MPKSCVTCNRAYDAAMRNHERVVDLPDQRDAALRVFALVSPEHRQRKEPHPQIVEILAVAVRCFVVDVCEARHRYSPNG
jgi:hypothetical protein